jgi:cbb3-type cytochrome oxidase subunit 3
MDINFIRILVTIAALAAFLAILWWAYTPSRRERLDAEARRILKEIDE